jgi:hypothetical protein
MIDTKKCCGNCCSFVLDDLIDKGWCTWPKIDFITFADQGTDCPDFELAG